MSEIILTGGKNTQKKNHHYKSHLVLFWMLIYNCMRIMQFQSQWVWTSHKMNKSCSSEIQSCSRIWKCPIFSSTWPDSLFHLFERTFICLCTRCLVGKQCSMVCSHFSQLMRLWYLSHRRPAKAQASLRICPVSPEPLLFVHMKYGSRRRVRPNLRQLALLDRCACVFEEWVYGGRKVP